MHPPLAKHRHPKCLKEIEALQACHKERSIAKFFGVCNQQAKVLDQCLYAEHLETIEENQKRKKEQRKKYREPHDPSKHQ